MTVDDDDPREEENASGQERARDINSSIVWNQPPPRPGQGSNVNVYLGLTASYQSQLPPAHEVARLEALLPGTLDRLLGLQERALELGSIEQNHRHQIELHDSSRKSRGQWIALGVFILGLLVTLVLGLNHEDAVAKVTGGGTLLGAVAIFATGKLLSRDASNDDPQQEK